MAKDKASQTINILYGQKRYALPMEVYNEDRLVLLPNGTLLEIIEWFELMPPSPKTIDVVDTIDLSGTTLEQAAKEHNAVIARLRHSKNNPK